MGIEPEPLLLTGQMVNEKSTEHIPMNNEISTKTYNNILESLEATVTKDNKIVSPEPNSKIAENNPKDFKFLNEELPIHDFKNINNIHSKIFAKNKPMDYKSLIEQLLITVTDNTFVNEEIINIQSKLQVIPVIG